MIDSGRSTSAVSLRKSGDSVAETVFERLVSCVRLPYAVNCILLAVALGTPGTLLTRYLDSHDFARAFSIAGIVTGSESYWRAVAFYWVVAYFVFLLYLFYFVRYFRLKLVNSRAKLSPLLAGGEEAYDRVFRVVSSPIGALATSAIVGGSFAPSVYRMIMNSLGPISTAHVLISQVTLDLAGGTGIWLFFSSVWGLRKLGKGLVKVRPSAEDPLLGLGPIGSISFAMVLVYFGAVGLRGLGILASGVETTPTAVNVAFEAILFVFGLIAFLTTIHVYHKKMVDQKQLEIRKVIQQRMAVLNRLSTSSNPKSEDRIAGVRFLVTDMIERKLERTHTWPFDTGVFGGISTVVVSVTAIVAARVIVVFLNL